MQVIDDKKQRFVLDKDIAGGGEARIWSAHGNNNIVAKIYKNPSREKEEKLKAMLVSPPDGRNVAWPISILYDRNGKKFIGFLMHNVSCAIQIFRFYNSAARKQTITDNISYRYFHGVAKNLIIAVKSIHSKGHLIGDINESNILVDKNFRITFVDSDSFQVTDKK